MSTIQEWIESTLRRSFICHHLEVVNESHSHNVPKNSETHFKLLLVSDDFREVSRIDRQRKINEVLGPAFSRGLHALTQKAMTVEEYENWKGKFESPDCHGGSKR